MDLDDIKEGAVTVGKYALGWGIVAGLLYGVFALNSTFIKDTGEELGTIMQDRLTYDLINSGELNLQSGAKVDLTFVKVNENTNAKNLQLYGTVDNGDVDYAFKTSYSVPTSTIDLIKLKRAISYNKLKEAIDMMELDEINIALLTEYEKNIISSQDTSTLTSFLGSASFYNNDSDPKNVQPMFFHPLFMEASIVEENGKKYGVLTVDGIDIHKLYKDASYYNYLSELDKFLYSETYYRTDVLTLELDSSHEYTVDDVKMIMINKIEMGQTQNIVKHNSLFSSKIDSNFYTMLSEALYVDPLTIPNNSILEKEDEEVNL